MNVLVLGGTGTVGSQVVRELAQRGADVSILTRDAKKPVPAGARAVVGDLLDPATIRSAFAGRDAVFLVNAVSPTECHEGLMAVNGARIAGVKKAVYLSVQDADKATHLPHFGSKFAVETALRASGVPFTILRPNNFFQNDLLFKDAMLGYDVYPQPFGDVGLSRVDVRDIAEAAALALTTNAAAGETINVGRSGRPDGDGDRRHVGRRSRPQDRVRRKRSRRVGEGDARVHARVRGLRLPAHVRSSSRRRASRRRRKTSRGCTALLGHPPRRFDEFAAETARSWSA